MNSENDSLLLSKYIFSSCSSDTLAKGMKDFLLECSSHIFCRGGRSYEPWTEKEDRKLFDLQQSGMGISQVALQMNRSAGAIRSRCHNCMSEKIYQQNFLDTKTATSLKRTLLFRGSAT